MILPNTESAPSGQPLRDASATLLTLGGVMAAFSVASCCGIPFLLATLGVSSAWLASIALLAAPHRTLLLWAGALCLAAGAVLLWRRQPTTVCATDSACSKPAMRGLTGIGLIAGLALLAIGYLYA